ncbi:hypothetical protein GH714_020966 [Hevea brasiliensis]|uniref:Uncharacterized protein n=1 Tax=Hevea brasiliensis TaxID=3981 RepID=A0A6A6LT38_HEVBR|nr:hypothetical protein GH714_020966 [Hevea brasiliensis]
MSLKERLGLRGLVVAEPHGVTSLPPLASETMRKRHQNKSRRNRGHKCRTESIRSNFGSGLSGNYFDSGVFRYELSRSIGGRAAITVGKCYRSEHQWVNKHGEVSVTARESLMRLLGDVDGRGRVGAGMRGDQRGAIQCAAYGEQKRNSIYPCGHTYCRGVDNGSEEIVNWALVL